MITVTRLGEFGHRRRRRWRVRRSIQIYSDSHWGRMNSKVEIIWLRARLPLPIANVVYGRPLGLSVDTKIFGKKKTHLILPTKN